MKRDFERQEAAAAKALRQKEIESRRELAVAERETRWRSQLEQAAVKNKALEATLAQEKAKRRVQQIELLRQQQVAERAHKRDEARQVAELVEKRRLAVTELEQRHTERESARALRISREHAQAQAAHQAHPLDLPIHRHVTPDEPAHPRPFSDQHQDSCGLGVNSPPVRMPTSPPRNIEMLAAARERRLAELADGAQQRAAERTAAAKAEAKRDTAIARYRVEEEARLKQQYQEWQYTEAVRQQHETARRAEQHKAYEDALKLRAERLALAAQGTRPAPPPTVPPPSIRIRPHPTPAPAPSSASTTPPPAPTQSPVAPSATGPE
ncbi:hypothetical protein PAPYR_7775 [Paratrimastix pyriformis]|uniref:Uncharacterized protein n=1 Tax=Paratrimastix pyriformis TaxID=342808 RepID=A0ABQ8UDH8_9EUKA|nr:hypothetical protein PAPYR_7775 [Paratrimastix pyriformis]